MTEQLTIYITPPSTDRGVWRIRSPDRPIREMNTEEEAVRYAAAIARMVEGVGGEAVIKMEKADGSWETFRC